MTKSRTIVAGVALAGTAALLINGGIAATAGTPGAEKGTITVAVFNGWDESIAASELWKHVLEQEGYGVELVYADPAAAYTGIANGQYDLALDTWLPTTHAEYMEEFGDQLVDLGAWNDESSLTIAVNEDAPIDSLSELAANSELFGDRLVGIEAGAGLTSVTQNEVIPGYGLEGMEFVVSSTPAMLTELQRATEAGQNIAVTLWRPHWAYNAFPVKDLEDPEGLLGGVESIHSVASSSFAEDFPEVTGWIEDFRMDNDRLYSLGDAMFNGTDTDDYGPIVEEWVAENQEYVDGLTG